MNSKLVFHILGLVLRVEAVLMLPSAAIGFAARTGDGPDFLLSAAITLIVGQLLTLLTLIEMGLFAAAVGAGGIMELMERLCECVEDVLTI